MPQMNNLAKPKFGISGTRCSMTSLLSIFTLAPIAGAISLQDEWRRGSVLGSRGLATEHSPEKQGKQNAIRLLHPSPVGRRWRVQNGFCTHASETLLIVFFSIWAREKCCQLIFAVAPTDATPIRSRRCPNPTSRMVKAPMLQDPLLELPSTPFVVG